MDRWKDPPKALLERSPRTTHLLEGPRLGLLVATLQTVQPAGRDCLPCLDWGDCVVSATRR